MNKIDPCSWLFYHIRFKTSSEITGVEGISHCVGTSAILRNDAYLTGTFLTVRTGR